MARRRWRGHRDKGGETAGTREGALPPASIQVLAVGAAIAGIAGAIVAVPITAALVRAWPYLQGRVPAPPAGAHADQPGEAAQRR